MELITCGRPACTVLVYAGILALASLAAAQDDTSTTTLQHSVTTIFSASASIASSVSSQSSTATISDTSNTPTLSTSTSSDTSITSSTTTNTASISTTSFPSLTTSFSTGTSTSTTFLGSSSTSTTSSTITGLTNAPTLSGYVIPTLIVPDTSGAPFMQKSNLPEGTVFICVGAALGLLGMCVIVWRGWVAWSLQRSVQRAASFYRTPDSKSSYRPGPFGGRPRHPYDGNNMSLEHLTSTNTAYQGFNDGMKERSGQRRDRTKGQQNRTPNSNALFFSPTAGASASFHQPLNRASGYLPAGYYATGSVAPSAVASIPHLGGPVAVGYGRIESLGDTPPDTPRTRPSAGRRMSSGRETDGYGGRDPRRGAGGHLDVEVPGQRTPSAVLDSWFEHSTAMGRTDRL